MGGHYFYALSILELSLIRYHIAWFILVRYAQKVAEVLSDLWLLIWWNTH